MGFAQPRCAERTLDGNFLAERERFRHIGARRAAGHTTDMQLDPRIVGLVGHGIIAWLLPGEANRAILPGRKQERAAGDHLEADAPDVVGHVVERRDPAREAADRMAHRLVLAKPGDFDVRPRHRATGQHQPVSLLVLGQCEIGKGRHLHFAGDQPRLAGAAISRPAAMGIGNAFGKRGLQNRLAHLDRDWVVASLDFHGKGQDFPHRASNSIV